MRRIVMMGILFVFFFSIVSTGADEEPLQGFTTGSSATERQWEAKFQALPSPDNQREFMRRLTARPHHVGSPYDKENADWILSKFKEWGWDAKIETFDVLFPTPKERLLEMVEPTRFAAKLQEPQLPVDPTSKQQSEQLPSYNAYSVDGDVTAPLIFVNYGLPKDYEQLDLLGISVKGQSSSQSTAIHGAASSQKWLPNTVPSAASYTPIQATTAISWTMSSLKAPCGLPTVSNVAAFWIFRRQVPATL